MADLYYIVQKLTKNEEKLPASITTKDERTTYADLFTQYLSDITIEVEGIKIKAERNDIKGINKHVARINSALVGIMDAKLDLAEKCNNINNISEITDKLPKCEERSDKYEIPITKNVHDKKMEIMLAIKETLLELGEPIYEKVVEYLYREYHCVITDCYEHPEYLNAILKKIFGHAHIVIVESIKKRLEKSNEQKQVQEFLTVISR